MSVHLHNIKRCEIFCSNCVALNHTQLDYIDPKSAQDIGYQEPSRYFCDNIMILK